MGSRFAIAVPGDYLLHRDVCSYGYFLLAPNVWDPRARTLTRPLHLREGVATVTLGQPGGAMGSPVAVKTDRALSRAEKAEAGRQVARMLCLDDPGLAGFWESEPRRRPGSGDGRGRLFRSPSFFEDLIKTVTSCNVAWPSTVRMNRRLCEVIHPAFPTAAQLARRRPSTLRARCGVGYRDRRIVELARLVASGEVDPAWYEDPGRTDEEILGALLALPGIGPYSAANVLQHLGRYSRLALDTEAVRHGRENLGMSGTVREVERQLEARYARHGSQRFRAYWFDLLEGYERAKGPSWTWEPRTVGASFTASRLRSGGA